MLRILDLAQAQELITRKSVRLAEAEQVVAPILEAVRTRGDEAVLEYEKKFNVGHALACPQKHVTSEFLTAIHQAATNIRDYAQTQLPREHWITLPDGRRLGQIVRPLESMGAYIPSGRYPLPSTLLMTVIPAQVAGVKTICIASPNPSPEILACAQFLGVNNVFRMGGAQASISGLGLGEAIQIVFTPATCAGITVINRVDGSG